MKKVNSLLLLPLLLGLSACTSLKNSTAMKPGQTAEKFFSERKQVLAADYLLFLPIGYGVNPTKHWPLILFLHGAGERGSDI
jgi:predicted peptidase